MASKKKATAVLVESAATESAVKAVESKETKKKGKEKGEVLFDINFSGTQFEELTIKVAFAARLIPPHPVHEVLANIKIEANKDGSICLTAYDLYTGADIFQECNVITPGCVLIPGKLLNGMLAKLPPGNIRITATAVPYSDTIDVVIKSGTIKYSISGLSAKDLEGSDQYPAIPATNDAGTELILPADVLIGGITRTFFTISSDETKQILTGVRLKTGDSIAEFASTDGYRLSRFKTQVEGIADLEVILPRKFLSKMKEAIDLERELSGCDRVHLIVEDDRLFLTTDSCFLVARRLLGEYPKIESLIPDNYLVTATLNTKHLFAGVCIAAVYAAQATNDAMKVSLSEDGLVLQATAQNIGDALEHVECHGVSTKEPFDFGVNYKYFQSAVKNMPTESMTLNANNPTAPVVFKSVSDDSASDEFMCLLMPIQFRE